MPHRLGDFSLQLNIFFKLSSSTGFLCVRYLLCNCPYDKFAAHGDPRIIRAPDLIQIRSKTSPLSGLVLDDGELAGGLQTGLDTREARACKFVELEDLITTKKKVRHPTMPPPFLKQGVAFFSFFNLSRLSILLASHLVEQHR